MEQVEMRLFLKEMPGLIQIQELRRSGVVARGWKYHDVLLVITDEQRICFMQHTRH